MRIVLLCLWALDVLLLAPPAQAGEEAPPPGGAGAAATKPKPEPKDKPEPKEKLGLAEVVPAARAFLRAVGDEPDEAAYELASPAYRATYTLAEFGDAMGALRKRAPGLDEIRRFNGSVSAKSPRGDGAPRTLVFTNAPAAPPAPAPQRVGLELVRVDGKWLVDRVHEVKDHVAFHELNNAFGKDHPSAERVSSALYGLVVRVDGDSVTLSIRETPGGADEERTLKLDDKTEVSVLGANVVPTSTGERVRVPELLTATRADVKPGMRANMVELSEDGERIESMMMTPGADADGEGL